MGQKSSCRSGTALINLRDFVLLRNQKKFQIEADGSFNRKPFNKLLKGLPPTQPLEKIDAEVSLNNVIDLLSSDGVSTSSAGWNGDRIADVGFPSGLRAELDALGEFDTEQLHGWSSSGLDGALPPPEPVQANMQIALPTAFITQQPILGRVETAVVAPRL
jgi:hypothetical protein